MDYAGVYIDGDSVVLLFKEGSESLRNAIARNDRKKKGNVWRSFSMMENKGAEPGARQIIVAKKRAFSCAFTGTKRHLRS